MRNQLRTFNVRQGLEKVYEGMSFPSELVTTEYGKVIFKNFRNLKKFISSSSMSSLTLPKPLELRLMSTWSAL